MHPSLCIAKQTLTLPPKHWGRPDARNSGTRVASACGGCALDRKTKSRQMCELGKTKCVVCVRTARGRGGGKRPRAQNHVASVCAALVGSPSHTGSTRASLENHKQKTPTPPSDVRACTHPQPRVLCVARQPSSFVGVQYPTAMAHLAIRRVDSCGKLQRQTFGMCMTRVCVRACVGVWMMAAESHAAPSSEASMPSRTHQPPTTM